MKRAVFFVVIHVASCLLANPGAAISAEDRAAAKTGERRRAVSRGIAILEKAARNYPTNRECFSCHHQTLPLLAMTHAGLLGLKIDKELMKSQRAFTDKSFRGRIKRLKAGKGIGGRAMTVGYGLWMLSLSKAPQDELTESMVTFLLKTQDKQGRWRTQGRRPPLEESSVAVTVLAVRGMQQYVGKSQKTDVDKAIARAKSWLADVKPQSQEDRNMLLWSVKLIGGEKTKLAAYRKDVLKTQQPDGGWSQKPGMKSDAYATGQTVFVLLQTGLLPTSPAVRKGLAYLSKTQQQDGSWFVKTRSKPVQKYFDNGDPHGKSQFISISATAWATAALADSMKRVDASTK